MADIPAIPVLRREDIASITSNPRAARAMEMQAEATAVTLPAGIDQAQAAAGTAQGTANGAQTTASTAVDAAAAAQATADAALTQAQADLRYVLGSVGPSFAAMTGTASRATFATYAAPTISNPPTQAEVQAIADAVQTISQHLKALIDDLLANKALTT